MQLQLFDKNTNIYESQVWATLMPVLVRVTMKSTKYRIYKYFKVTTRHQMNEDDDS